MFGAGLDSVRATLVIPQEPAIFALENQQPLATEKQNSPGVPINNATVQTVRDWLAQRYERRYRQKMADRLPVNLHFHASLHGIREGDRSSFIEVPAEAAGGQLRKVFQQTKGRLLLLGAPGAGKTMQLIQLAQDLLASEPDAMPVILNLATWTSEYPTLLDWLKKSLPYELGTNDPLALKLLAHRRVILLLDGFDEMAPQHRVSFFEKTAEHLVAQPHQEFVISTRIQEYLEAAVEKTPPVEHQPVEVAALSIEQIREKLELLKKDPKHHDAGRFLAALNADPLLCVAAAKPFYFNCLQMLFALKPWSEWQFLATTQEGREAEIAERFIEQELKKCSKPGTRRWLGILASRMEEREMVVFELRDLQYDWWGKWSWWQIGVGRLVELLIVGLPIGLFLGLLLEVFMVLPIGLVIGSMEAMGRGLMMGLIFGPAFVLFIWFIGMLIGRRHLAPLTIETRDLVHWEGFSWHSRKIDLTTGVTVGVAAGLVGLVKGFYGVLLLGPLYGVGLLLSIALIKHWVSSNKFFLQITHPYQRFTASAKNLWFSILQHWHLRHLLARKGLLPRRLVHFLNEMAPLEKNSRGEWPQREFTKGQVYLMETDGATWRFRHRIIQEWFAARGESGGEAVARTNTPQSF